MAKWEDSVIGVVFGILFLIVAVTLVQVFFGIDPSDSAIYLFISRPQILVILIIILIIVEMVSEVSRS